MHVDVKSKVKPPLPATAAAPPPVEAAPSLTDRLLDPLARKAGLNPAAGSGLPDLAAGLQTAPASPTAATPSVAPSQGDVKAATTASTPRLASGEKVVRNLWLVDGKLPWAAIEQFMGEKIAPSIKEIGNHALQGKSLEQPYVELIRQGDGIALQVEDNEHIVVGPIQLKADFYAPAAATGDQAGDDTTPNDAGQAGRALVHDLGGALNDAKRSQTGLQATASEIEAIRGEMTAANDAGEPLSRAARAGARNLAADGERRMGALTSMMQTMEARLAEVQDGLGGADGGEGDAQALLQQAETLLSQVADQVSAAQALLDRIRDAAEYVQGNDQE